MGAPLLCDSVTVSLCLCVTVSLCHCATVPLCHCVTVSLCHCVTVSLSRCAAVPLRHCVTVLLRPCHSVTHTEAATPRCRRDSRQTSCRGELSQAVWQEGSRLRWPVPAQAT